MKLLVYPMRTHRFYGNKLEMMIELDYGSKKDLPKNFWLAIWRLNRKSSANVILNLIQGLFRGHKIGVWECSRK